MAKTFEHLTLGEANKTFSKSFKNLNPDETLGSNFPIGKNVDWKHLKNFQADTNQGLRGHLFPGLRNEFGQKKHKARQDKPERPSHTTGSNPIFNSLSYFIVSEYKKKIES